MRGASIVLAGLLIGGISGAASAADVYASRLTAVAYDGAMRASVQGDGHVTAGQRVAAVPGLAPRRVRRALGRGRSTGRSFDSCC